MDWTRAKTILIIGLLLTNCMLGGLYYQQYMKNNAVYKSEVQDTLEFLKNHHIYLDTEIPEKTRKMSVLTVRYDDTDWDMVQDVLAEQETDETGENGSMTEETLRKLCDTILDRCGFVEDTLAYDSCQIDGSQAEVRYKNIYDGIALEKSGIVCKITDGRIEEIQRHWIRPVEYGKTRQRVIPAADALIQFATEWVKKKSENTDGNLPSEIHIGKIELVYWLNPAVESSGGVEDTALPAWRITYNGGEETFIDAFIQR